jgi:hypothetical protein
VSLTDPTMQRTMLKAVRPAAIASMSAIVDQFVRTIIPVTLAICNKSASSLGFYSPISHDALYFVSIASDIRHTSIARQIHQICAGRDAAGKVAVHESNSFVFGAIYADG